MDINKITEGLVEAAGGEDAFNDMMAEIADECYGKMSTDVFRNICRNARGDGCNLMQGNYIQCNIGGYN